MTIPNPVSVVHMMDNKSQIADISTWFTGSSEPGKQWRGGLRFRTEDPNSPIGFSIERDAESQDKVITELMNLYKSLVQFMEQCYANAVARISVYVEDITTEKSFAVDAVSAHIHKRPFGVIGMADLEFYNPAKLSMRFMAGSQDEAAQMAKTVQNEMTNYMNNRLSMRLRRLAEFLGSPEAHNLVTLK